MKYQRIDIEIPVQFWIEEGIYIAWTPALDLASQGESLEHAKKMFLEALELFIESHVARASLNDALEEYGWKRKSRGWDIPYEATDPSQLMNVQIPLVC